MKKRSYIWITALLVTSMLAGCGADSESGKKSGTNSNQTSSKQDETGKKPVPDDGLDHGLGLKLTKVQDTEGLTEQQQKVVQYFDDDYIALSDIHAYEFLKRYPDVFKGAQIQVTGTVKKVISSDDENFEMLVWLGPCKAEMEWYWDYSPYSSYAENSDDNLVVIKGKLDSHRWIVGDEIEIRGVYQAEEAYTNGSDDTEQMLPVIEANEVCFDNSFGYATAPERYDAKYIKDVATAIFGEEITITAPQYSSEEVEEDWENCWESIMETEEYGVGYVWNLYYTCELDNQTNSDFTRFYFLNSKGMVVDEKSYGVEEYRSEFEFAPDFEHFMMFSSNQEEGIDEAYIGDPAMDVTAWNAQIEYYNRDLNQVWQREFEDSVIRCYDYTSTAIYAVINQDLHILDIETGEDVVEPRFVGTKAVLRKMEDGILSIDYYSENADSIMKTDLNGEVLWTTNLPGSADQIGSIQLVDNHIVVSTWLVVDDELDEHYLVYDNETGELIQDVVALQNQE